MRENFIALQKSSQQANSRRVQHTSSSHAQTARGRQHCAIFTHQRLCKSPAKQCTARPPASSQAEAALLQAVQSSPQMLLHQRYCQERRKLNGCCSLQSQNAPMQLTPAHQELAERGTTHQSSGSAHSEYCQFAAGTRCKQAMQHTACSCHPQPQPGCCCQGSCPHCTLLPTLMSRAGQRHFIPAYLGCLIAKRRHRPRCAAWFHHPQPTCSCSDCGSCSGCGWVQGFACARDPCHHRAGHNRHGRAHRSRRRRNRLLHSRHRIHQLCPATGSVAVQQDGIRTMTTRRTKNPGDPMAHGMAAVESPSQQAGDVGHGGMSVYIAVHGQ